MSFFSLLFLAVGLSMDAFAVAICKGLALKKIQLRHAVIVGLWFGGFQGLMPMAGYFLGTQFERFVSAVAPWVAFGLLLLIGLNMIREALSGKEEETDASLDVREMFMLAVATSIDAFAVGVSYAMVPVRILLAGDTANALLACGLTAVTTFAISALGVKIGSIFGTRYQKRAVLAGGATLILIGLQMLLKHFGLFG